MLSASPLEVWLYSAMAALAWLLFGFLLSRKDIAAGKRPQGVFFLWVFMTLMFAGMWFAARNAIDWPSP